MATIETFAEAFLELTDVNETSFAGEAGNFPQVNPGETALEFFDLFAAANTWTGVNTHTADVVTSGANIHPATDQTDDLGEASPFLRFNTVRARAGQFVGSDGAGVGVTIGVNGDYSVVGGSISGYGSNLMQFGGGTYPPAGMFGNVFTYNASGVARMRHQGGGSFMVGSSFVQYYGTAYIDTDANSFGSFTGGYTYPAPTATAGASAGVRNRSRGGFVWGYPNPDGGGVHRVRTVNANAQGAFVVGRTFGTGTSRVESNSAGTFSQGVVYSYAGYISRIRCQAAGGFAQGYCYGGAAATDIIVQGLGGFAQGYATDADIRASGNGSFAHGFANDNEIRASGAGAMAIGDSSAGIIYATAANSGQLGPGTNAVAISWAVGDITGTGLRVIGGGAPGVPVNGDIWKAGGVGYWESGGVTVRIGSGAAGWTGGAYAVRRSFVGLTPTLGETLELLETLVEELQANGVIN